MVYYMCPYTMSGLAACMLAGVLFLNDALLGILARSMAIYTVLLSSVGRPVLQHALHGFPPKYHRID